LSSFSARGPTADNRIKPEVVAMGENTVVVNPTSTTAYTTNSGTSFSAPLVAGAVAVILSAKPDLTPHQVRQLLLDTASNHATPNNEIGWGLIDIIQVLDANFTKNETTKPPIECDCGGNGVCVNGLCTCYAGYTGEHCEIAPSSYGSWKFYGNLVLKFLFSLWSVKL
jgi:hypothetical protein